MIIIPVCFNKYKMTLNATWTLNDFTGIFVLQKGKYGEVFTGIDTKTGIRYAIKKILKKVNVPEYSFKNELDIHSQLDHPNIIKVYGHFEDDSYNYMVMEYASHTDLITSNFSLCRYNEKETSKIIKCLLNVILYLHNKGIVHNDIKMENLLLTENGCIKLCDFGLSVQTDNIKTWTSSKFCGTLQYIAPEKFTYGTYSYMVDVWSVGCVAYELYCLRSAFRCLTKDETIRKIVFGNVTLPDTMSSTFMSFIFRLLDKDFTTRMTIEGALQHLFITDDANTPCVSPRGPSTLSFTISCDSNASTVYQTS